MSESSKRRRLLRELSMLTQAQLIVMLTEEYFQLQKAIENLASAFEHTALSFQKLRDQ